MGASVRAEFRGREGEFIVGFYPTGALFGPPHAKF